MRDYLFIFILVILASCKSKQLTCKAFDFNRIPYDSLYYIKVLNYTSKNDTLSLLLESKNYSKKSVWGSFGYECNPYFEVSYADKSKRISILYSFNYFDMDNADESTYLNIHINSSRIELNLDTVINKINNELIIDNNIYQMNKNEFAQMIRKIKFQKMRITEIETYSGQIWKISDK